MATFEVVLSQTLLGEPVQMAFHYNDLAMPAGVPGAPAALATAFENNVLPAILDIQAQQVATVSIYARDLGNPGGAVTNANTDPGAVVAATSEVMPVDIPLYLRLAVGQWYSVTTGAAYVGIRPGKAGGKYLPGTTEDWNQGSTASRPSALATQWTAFQTALLAPLPLAGLGVTLDPVVWSAAKAASGGLPARDPLVAPISSVTIRRFTRLLSRRP